jgi:hypothetical protein
MRRLSLLPDVGPRPEWNGHRLPPGWRSLRIAIAATLAYVVSLPLTGETAPVLAPLAALLVSQTTAHKSLVSGARRVLGVVAGVLVAAFLSSIIGLTWWSIGLTVFAALLLGALLRLGDVVNEVAITALLVLTVSGQRDFAIDRLWETLIGAAVGVAVNVLFLPPVYVQPAGDALITLGRAMAAQLSDTAAGLRKDWTEESARKWLAAAWKLDQPQGEARNALATAEDSLRLNPRQRRARQADDSLRSGLSALEHAAIIVRGLMTALVDRVRGAEEKDMPSADARLALADVLDDQAAAIRAFAEMVGADVNAPWQAEEELAEALARARRRPDALVEKLAVDAHTQPGLWRIHGALLANLDRLLYEVDPNAGTQAGGARREAAEIEPWVAAMRRVARQTTARDRSHAERSRSADGRRAQ